MPVPWHPILATATGLALHRHSRCAVGIDTLKKKQKRWRVVMARVSKWRDGDDSFDVEFRRRVGAEGRLAAMWQRVVDFDFIKGGDGRIPRLAKNVERVERRPRKAPRRQR